MLFLRFFFSLKRLGRARLALILLKEQLLKLFFKSTTFSFYCRKFILKVVLLMILTPNALGPVVLILRNHYN